MPHQGDRVRSQIAAAFRHVPTHHRHKRLPRALRLKKVRRSELGVIGHRISPTDLEFDPQSALAVITFQRNVDPEAAVFDRFAGGENPNLFHTEIV